MRKNKEQSIMDMAMPFRSCEKAERPDQIQGELGSK
jgi:hypothetical protein